MSLFSHRSRRRGPHRLILVITLLVSSACAGAAQPLSVVASIFPLGDVARRVGGDVVSVEILLPPGQSPHGFEPKPAQAEALARADILLTVGFEVDVWAERLAEAARNPRLHRVTLARSVGPQASSGSDPHAWLDPVVMSALAADLASAMIELRPDAGAAIAVRAAAYRAELDSLDAAYRVRLAKVPGKAFVTLHAAFAYLAARYGLQQVAIFDSDMHEPGPRALEGAVRFIRGQAVPVLFVQPQLSPSAVALLREETGVRVMTLDDLGNPLQPGYDSYLAMMRSNLDALAAGLGEPR